MSIQFQTFLNIEDPEQYGDLHAPIVDCIHAAFGRTMPEDETLSVLTSDFVIVATDEDSGQVIAFASMNKHAAQKRIPEASANETLMSLQAGLVRPEYQGQGLYRELNRRRIVHTIEQGSTYIITATQNPRVEHGIRVALEESIKQGKLASFALERQVREGLYAQQLSNFDYPLENSPYVDLDMQRGDAFFLTFKLQYVEDV